MRVSFFDITIHEDNFVIIIITTLGCRFIKKFLKIDYDVDTLKMIYDIKQGINKNYSLVYLNNRYIFLKFDVCDVILKIPYYDSEEKYIKVKNLKYLYYV